MFFETAKRVLGLLGANSVQWDEVVSVVNALIKHYQETVTEKIPDELKALLKTDKDELSGKELMKLIATKFLEAACPYALDLVKNWYVRGIMDVDDTAKKTIERLMGAIVSISAYVDKEKIQVKPGAEKEVIKLSMAIDMLTDMYTSWKRAYLQVKPPETINTTHQVITKNSASEAAPQREETGFFSKLKASIFSSNEEDKLPASPVLQKVERAVQDSAALLTKLSVDQLPDDTLLAKIAEFVGTFFHARKTLAISAEARGYPQSLLLLQNQLRKILITIHSSCLREANKPFEQDPQLEQELRAVNVKNKFDEVLLFFKAKFSKRFVLRMARILDPFQKMISAELLSCDDFGDNFMRLARFNGDYGQALLAHTEIPANVEKEFKELSKEFAGYVGLFKSPISTSQFFNILSQYFKLKNQLINFDAKDLALLDAYIYCFHEFYKQTKDVFDNYYAEAIQTANRLAALSVISIKSEEMDELSKIVQILEFMCINPQADIAGQLVKDASNEEVRLVVLTQQLKAKYLALEQAAMQTPSFKRSGIVGGGKTLPREQMESLQADKQKRFRFCKNAEILVAQIKQTKLTKVTVDELKQNALEEFIPSGIAVEDIAGKVRAWIRQDKGLTPANDAERNVFNEKIKILAHDMLEGYVKALTAALPDIKQFDPESSEHQVLIDLVDGFGTLVADMELALDLGRNAFSHLDTQSLSRLASQLREVNEKITKAEKDIASRQFENAVTNIRFLLGADFVSQQTTCNQLITALYTEFSKPYEKEILLDTYAKDKELAEQDFVAVEFLEAKGFDMKAQKTSLTLRKRYLDDCEKIIVFATEMKEAFVGGVSINAIDSLHKKYSVLDQVLCDQAFKHTKQQQPCSINQSLDRVLQGAVRSIYVSVSKIVANIASVDTVGTMRDLWEVQKHLDKKFVGKYEAVGSTIDQCLSNALKQKVPELCGSLQIALQQPVGVMVDDIKQACDLLVAIADNFPEQIKNFIKADFYKLVCQNIFDLLKENSLNNVKTQHALNLNGLLRAMVKVGADAKKEIELTTKSRINTSYAILSAIANSHETKTLETWQTFFAMQLPQPTVTFANSKTVQFAAQVEYLEVTHFSSPISHPREDFHNSSSSVAQPPADGNNDKPARTWGAPAPGM